MELVLGIQDGEAFVIDEPIRSQNVQSQMRVGVGAANLIPLPAYGPRIAIRVQDETLV